MIDFFVVVGWKMEMHSSISTIQTLLISSGNLGIIVLLSGQVRSGPEISEGGTRRVVVFL
jgi:hypothetical protein